MLSRRRFRLTAAIAAGLCVLAIVAGAFAFSYPGVRDTALVAGLSPRLARFYPLLFDAALVVACVAVVTLRGVLRGFAWLAVLVIVGAVATADTVRAMSITVPPRPLEATIAIAPWVVLLTGLTLLDAIFRRTPGRTTQAVDPVSANGRAPATASPESRAGQPAGALAVPLSALFHESPRAPARSARAAASQRAAGPNRATVTASDPAADPSRDRTTASDPATGPSGATVTASEPAADASQPEATASPPQTGAGQAAAADLHEGRPREG